MDKQIYVEGNLIHPETNSGVVTHNNSNLKNFLNGLVSTDNMPAFMQNFLQSQNYVQANQALKTNPETYFDYAFNTWTAANAPVVSGGNCTFNGSNQYLTCTPGWTIGAADFSIEIKFMVTSFSKSNPIFYASQATAAGGILISCETDTSGLVQFRNRNTTNGTAFFTSSTNAINLNQWYSIEANYDSTSQTKSLFIDGNLVASNTQSIVANKIFKIGTTLNNSPFMAGSIDYVRISDCVRHTSSYTPQTPSFDDNTLSLLLFD